MAVDMFLKIEKIAGEATDDKHQEWIEVLAFSQGLSRPSASSSGGARQESRPDFQDFSITKGIDKSSPKLALAAANGELLPAVQLVLIRAAGNRQQFMAYDLQGVQVSSLLTSGDGQSGDGLPTEVVGLSFFKVEWTYTEIDDSGKVRGDVKASWDIAQNKGG